MKEIILTLILAVMLIIGYVLIDIRNEAIRHNLIQYDILLTMKYNHDKNKTN